MKITENVNEIPSTTDLAATATRNTKAADLWNKIQDVTNLATKADLNTKATEIQNKIISY